jgi:hypothetical protein
MQTTGHNAIVAALEKRLDRERKARAEAERISEEALREVYAYKSRLEASNRQLGALNAGIQERMNVLFQDLRDLVDAERAVGRVELPPEVFRQRYQELVYKLSAIIYR